MCYTEHAHTRTLSHSHSHTTKRTYNSHTHIHTHACTHTHTHTHTHICTHSLLESSVWSSTTGIQWTCECQGKIWSRTTSPTSSTTTRPSGPTLPEERRERGRSAGGPGLFEPMAIFSSTQRRLVKSVCVCV